MRKRLKALVVLVLVFGGGSRLLRKISSRLRARLRLEDGDLLPSFNEAANLAFAIACACSMETTRRGGCKDAERLRFGMSGGDENSASHCLSFKAKLRVRRFISGVDGVT